MGRSIRPAIPANLPDVPLNASYYNDATNRHFDVFTRNGKIYQSEFEVDAQGKEVFRDTRELKWIVGAGANGYGALVQKGNYLFEAPLSFYVQSGKWEPSPGFEKTDTAFSRPILGGCIACHSGRANLLDSNTGKFAATEFTEVSVGCENCHGPGEAHIAMEESGRPDKLSSRIVNPDRLSASLENDICLSCHEAGSARVPRPGKTYKDFRPGQPLDRTLSILMVPLKPGSTDNSDHVQHFFEMSMSKCYRATAGQLRCATCHDPHIEPTAAEAPEFFNQKCMDCHANQMCTLTAAQRAKTVPSNNCIGCHMPKRDVKDLSHSSLTNHRILARPGEPWPAEAFQMTTAALPDLVRVNQVPGGTSPLPEFTLLEAYRRIGERIETYKTRYGALLQELAESDPNHVEVQAGLGELALQHGDIQQAVEHFENAVKLDPERGDTYAELARALAEAGNLTDALTASKTAVALTPYNQLFRKVLIDQLISDKQYDQAIAAMEHYVQLFPEDTFMRKMLQLASQ